MFNDNNLCYAMLNWVFIFITVIVSHVCQWGQHHQEWIYSMTTTQWYTKLADIEQQ